MLQGKKAPWDTEDPRKSTKSGDVTGATCSVLKGSYAPYGHGFAAANTLPRKTLPHSRQTGCPLAMAEEEKARDERNTPPSGTLSLAPSTCLELLSVNLHRCAAEWITRWPFHLRNHNLNPAESHQRINGQRYSYFKVIKHLEKGKGGKFIFFLSRGVGHRFNWPPWLCYYKLEPRFGIERLPALALQISKSGRGPWLLQDRHSLTCQCVGQQSHCWDSDGWLNGTYSAWTQILAETTAQRQGALNYSLKRNLNISYCSFKTSDCGCIFKNKQINETI